MEDVAPNFQGEDAWQKFCTKTLTDAMNLVEHQRAPSWAEARERLIALAKIHIRRPAEQRIIIADADFTNASLSGFDFSHCYIVQTKFKGANLREADFRYAILRLGSLTDANVKGCNFDFSDLEGTEVQNLIYDEDTNLNFFRFRPSGTMSFQLLERIEQDKSVALGRDASPLVKFLNMLTGYGFGIGRLAFTSGIIVLLFAAIYYVIGASGFGVGVATRSPEDLTIWNFFLFSAERFLNASPWIFGVSSLAHFLATFETLLGFLMLALMIAMLIRQVWRSS